MQVVQSTRMPAAPLDADYNFCGFDKTADFPKMVLSNYKLTSGFDVYSILKSGVCVKKCPKNAHLFVKNFKIHKNCLV